ncbi:DNA-protecting protein DprA [Actinomadura logoneensis]|uniref:DNA-protecting protein DprA n=1 Tax=Actinomadura logoneensis TaxID=2293572 RepID=A0A372JRL7_9ACTN|nr:DNA-processing protein DprA [Actinomadura logoneensis]RFU42436.1 DNA-protecting protein DprA [Actinomadura logoneensis]
MTEDRIARATLTALAEPGEPLLNELIDRLGAPETLTAIRRGRLPDETAAGIADDSLVARMTERLAHWRIRLSAAEPASDLLVAERLGVRLVCPGDPEWPTTLDDLGARRPYALWLRGPSDLRFGCLRSVALVGARAASSYGMRLASEMASELGECGWTVVSGGAMGIDAAAHRGSLAADGPTVAVLANGVDVPYPASNDGMFAEIARRELLVSESPPGTSPRRQRFLVRNRVIAALARGTVVVEAGRRSGALSTAHWARKLGRVVMAVPGPVTSATSVGCHALLRDPPPALLVTRSEEVIEAVGEFGTDLAPVPASPVLSRDLLDPVARTVLEALPSRAAAGPAQLAAKAGIDLPTANAKLGLLSAGGFVERAPGGWRLTQKAKAP